MLLFLCTAFYYARHLRIVYEKHLLRYIKVTSFHKRKKQGINHKLLIGNQFHITLRIISPIILFKSQKDESRAQSADSSKAYRKRRAFYGLLYYSDKVYQVNFHGHSSQMLLIGLINSCNG